MPIPFPGQSDDYLPDHWDLARTFGSLVRDTRLKKSRPDGSHGYSSCMTQADLGTRLHETWKLRTEEHRTFDAAWVRKLEHGEIRVDLRLARCVADALGADADETAVLLQAGGFNGVAIVLLGELGIDFDAIQADVSACLGSRTSPEVSLEEVLTVVRRERRVIRKEVLRLLQEQPD